MKYLTFSECDRKLQFWEKWIYTEVANNSSEENPNSNIQQELLNNNTVGRDVIIDTIQQNITVNREKIPPSNLRAPYREIFKSLIENSLTLFGGRDTSLAQIAKFINKATGGYLVITAPAGFGKTSLMVKLVSEASETFAYHFFAPYENPNSITEEGFLRNVVEQMALWHGYTDTLPEKLPDLQALYHHLLDKPLEHTRVLGIDGLDEVTNWKIARYLSRHLPDNLHIIVTVRDVGQDLAVDYDFPNDQTEYLQLGGLTYNDVAQVMWKAGKSATVFADNPTLLNEVMRVSAYQEEPSLGADPFYVHWLAEDAADGRLTPTNIATQPKGLEKYLDRWWQDIKKSTGEQPVKDLFGTLTAALGVISRQDLETINESLVDDWAADFFNDVLKKIRRFVIGNEERGYAVAHPRLRQYMLTKIKIANYNRKLLDFCVSWQENRSFYALRYYVEHLRDAKLWNDLYALARNKTFTDIQGKQLPDEPNLPLKTVQIAFSCAAEEDNAGLMAEFLLLHARWIEQTNVQESPLEALRKGSLERALGLAEINEMEHQVLWFLLLAWELKDTGRLKEAQAILKQLKQKNLPHLFIQADTRWKGNFAVYFLVYTLEISEEAFTCLYQQLLDDYYRKLLCINLKQHNYFTAAIEIALANNSMWERVSLLEKIAKSQAEKACLEAAQTTLAKAFSITRSCVPNSFWVVRMADIAKAQIETGGIEAGRSSLSEAIDTADKITNTSQQIDAMLALAKILGEVKIFAEAFKIIQKIDDQFDLEDSLIVKAKLQANQGQIDQARVTLITARQKIRNLEDKTKREKALVKLAKAQLEIRDTIAALEILEKIDNQLNKEDILREIVRLQVDGSHFSAALETASRIKNIAIKANVFSFIAQEQAKVSPFTDDGVETAKKIALKDLKESAFVEIVRFQARAENFSGAVKTKSLMNNEIQQQYALSAIAEAYAVVQEYNIAKEIAKSIGKTWIRVDTLGSIAKVEAEGNNAQAARSTFATALQLAQATETEFRLALALLGLAKLQLKLQQKNLGVANAKVAHQIAKKISPLREKAIVLALVAEVLAKVGKTQQALSIFDNAIKITHKINIQHERVDNFEFIAYAQARVEDFDLAKQTAEKIEFPWTKAKVLAIISKAQAFTGLQEESQITLSAAIEIADTLDFEEEWVDVGCSIAAAETVTDKEAAQRTFTTLLDFAQESYNRAGHLRKIAAALAEVGDIPKALKIIDKIEDAFELVRVLWTIAWVQFKKGEKVTTLSTALEAKNKIKDENKRLQALKIIAQIQVIVGEGQQAVKTVETILTDRYLYLPGIASLFVETGDKTNFKKLLIPCAYYLDSAYEMCGHIAWMYPEQAEAVAKVVKEFN